MLVTVLSWLAITKHEQITVFGESAGAISIGSLYFNSKLETLARAAVRNNSHLEFWELLNIIS